MLTYCQLNPQENISMKFLSKHNFFYQDNLSENFVYKMAAILFGPHELM